MCVRIAEAAARALGTAIAERAEERRDPRPRAVAALEVVSLPSPFFLELLEEPSERRAAAFHAGEQAARLGVEEEDEPHQRGHEAGAEAPPPFSGAGARDVAALRIRRLKAAEDLAERAPAPCPGAAAPRRRRTARIRRGTRPFLRGAAQGEGAAPFTVAAQGGAELRAFRGHAGSATALRMGPGAGKRPGAASRTAGGGPRPAATPRGPPRREERREETSMSRPLPAISALAGVAPRAARRAGEESFLARRSSPSTVYRDPRESISGTRPQGGTVRAACSRMNPELFERYALAHSRNSRSGSVARRGALLAALLLGISACHGASEDPAQEPTGAVAGGIDLYSGIPQDGIALGDPSAPITLVEFSDLRCSHCRDYGLEILPVILERHVRTKQVKLVFRNLAFLGPSSVQAARMAAAVGMQDRLFDFVDRFFRLQERERPAITDELLLRVASEVPGVDAEQAMAQRDSRRSCSSSRPRGPRRWLSRCAACQRCS